MSKKKKLTLISVFVAVVAVAAIVAVVLNQKSTTAGSEEFQGTDCIRERWLDQTTDCKSDAEFLGEILKEPLKAVNTGVGLWHLCYIGF